MLLPVKSWRSLLLLVVSTSFGMGEEFPPEAWFKKLRMQRKVWAEPGLPSPQVIVATSPAVPSDWVSPVTLNADYLNPVASARSQSIFYCKDRC